MADLVFVHLTNPSIYPDDQFSYLESRLLDHVNFDFNCTLPQEASPRIVHLLFTFENDEYVMKLSVPVQYQGTDINFATLCREQRMSFQSMDEMKQVIRSMDLEPHNAQPSADGQIATAAAAGRLSARKPATDRSMISVSRDTRRHINAAQLASDIRESVSGQDQAVEEVAHWAAMSAGKINPSRPVCILLAGETGVGKTFLARNLDRANVDLWKINRTSFYADIHVELTLQSEHGSRTWNGLLNCLCSFEENKKFLCDILSLTDKAWQDDDKGCVRLNPFLAPYYTNSQMDQIAEQIWKEYGMKEALTDPTKRNAIELAKRMGLSIEYYNVYEHQGVKSILFFTDSELIVGEDRMERQKDGSNKHIKDAHGEKVMIRANTIVINTNKDRKPYSTFAVYHECIHYYLHYMFFRLQEMGSNDVRNVNTVEIEIDEDKEYSDPIYFMEKQADRGAYGLMLPATHTKSIIADNIRKVTGYQNEGELFEIVGSRIAEDQGLADFRIRARMIQLGHIEAKGALNYVSRERIQPFAFNPDAWKENELSYVVDPWTVERLQKENKDFQAFMISGDYVYADGHVVLNDPKFVEEKGGRLFLTDEARKQVDACCLRFTRQYVQKYIGLYVYGRMFYDPEYVAQTKFYLSDMINERHLDELDARIAYRDEFPHTFVGAFDMLMKKNGQTRESVAPLLHTTERSLHDWLYNPDRIVDTAAML